jgi:hypothetical protein
MAGGSGPGGPAGPGGQPSEEELRAAYEAELARITSSDMMLQAAVSLLNIASYRLMPRPGPGAEAAAAAGGGQDLEQVRDSIDGVRALVGILERRVPAELGPLREALSQLQMAYAREMQAPGSSAPGGEQPGGEGDEGGGGGDAQGGGPGGQGGPGGSGGPGAPGGGQPGQGEGPSQQGPSGPGPAESSGRLWVPGR